MSTMDWQIAIDNAAEAVTLAEKLATSQHPANLTQAALANDRAQVWVRLADAVNRRQTTEAMKS